MKTHRPADVLPIGVPSRAELWSRVQLARSVLEHRQPCSGTNTLVLAILAGEHPDNPERSATS